MTIKGIEKNKIVRTVRDIESGTFEDRTIDSFFMGLREYAGNNLIFIEIANFIAHSSERNQGITYSTIERFYLSIRFQFEYLTPQKEINPLGPLPSWIKRLLLNQVNQLPQPKLKALRIKRNKLKAIIAALYTEDKTTNTISISKGYITETELHYFQTLVSFIVVRPAYNQKQVMEQILTTLELNKITYDKKLLLQQSDNITVCILSLIHSKKFPMEEADQAFTSISVENHSAPLDSFKNETSPVKFGLLSVGVTVNIASIGFPVGTTIFETNLSAEDRCGSELFSISYKVPDWPFMELNFEGRHIAASHDFRLIPVND